jgi:hypothetical protein
MFIVSVIDRERRNDGEQDYYINNVVALGAASATDNVQHGTQKAAVNLALDYIKQVCSEGLGERPYTNALAEANDYLARGVPDEQFSLTFYVSAETSVSIAWLMMHHAYQKLVAEQD